MSAERHVVIVGGGIVGLSTACLLARRGVAVTLLDTGPRDESASAGNAGLVAVGHGPLPRPGLARSALKWMFAPTSPLHIPPRPSLALLRWLWRFHRACAPSVHHESCRILAEHGHAAGAIFRRFVEDEGIACAYRPIGQYDVFMTTAALDGAMDEARFMEAHGYTIERIDGAELRRREPAAREGLAGALLFRDRAFADPGAFVAGLADRARAHGAIVHDDAPVARLVVEGGAARGVETTDGRRVEGDAIVLAAGAWSSALARAVGVPIPMEAAKGYHLMVETPAPCLATAAVLAERFVAVTPMPGGLRLGGTLEFSGIDDRIVARRVEMLVRGAQRYLEGLDAPVRKSTWCGLRPCTADGLPVVGAVGRVERLYVGTGHAMMGFSLGPLAGAILAASILGDDPPVDARPLSPDRFVR